MQLTSESIRSQLLFLGAAAAATDTGSALFGEAAS